MINSQAEEERLRELEARVCSYGDTVHYVEKPPIFTGCEGSFMYDRNDTPYLDLQMWYSVSNFGYRNPRLNDAVKRTLDTMPQIASPTTSSASSACPAVCTSTSAALRPSKIR
jgi:4-aminobutyrate aminotransferase/(S)-3-amino-2-methylpropionate transaminase